MPRVPRRSIETDRLLLRPTTSNDADRAFKNPVGLGGCAHAQFGIITARSPEIGRWFGDDEREWLAGEGYRFAVELEGRMIGMTDIDSIAEHEGQLGYGLDRSAWVVNMRLGPHVP